MILSHHPITLIDSRRLKIAARGILQHVANCRFQGSELLIGLHLFRSPECEIFYLISEISRHRAQKNPLRRASLLFGT